MQGDPDEQDKHREYFTLDAAVSVTRGQSSIIALPADELKISCTSADDRGIHTQHLSLTIDPDVYMAQIAAARTFAIYEDIEELLKLGKIKGGSLDCAVVIRRKATPVFDDQSGTYSPVSTLVYEGKARIYSVDEAGLTPLGEGMYAMRSTFASIQIGRAHV